LAFKEVENEKAGQIPNTIIGLSLRPGWIFESERFKEALRMFQERQGIT
jgi:hypothetical protein